MRTAYDPYARRGLQRSVPLDTALALRDKAQAAAEAEAEAKAAYRQLARRHDALQAELDVLREQLRQAEAEAAAIPEPEPVEPTEGSGEAAEGAEALQAAERLVAELRQDLANVRRHRDEAVARARREARSDGLGVVADGIDDLDRALVGLPPGDVAAGVRAVRDRLVRRLADAGAATFGAPGDRFDPERHEAIGLTAGPEGTVASVERRGLEQVDGPVIRPALVVVGAGRNA